MYEVQLQWLKDEAQLYDELGEPGSFEEGLLFNDAAIALEKTLKENERLREALQFYAAEGSWSNDEIDAGGAPAQVPYTAPIFHDTGKRARKALE